jgi:hypothetical protein
VQGSRPRVQPRAGRRRELRGTPTTRSSLLIAGERTREPLEWALRPVHRAYPQLVIEPGSSTTNGRRVPLRAWYPIEVLRLPFRSAAQVERRFGGGPGDMPAPRSRAEAELLEAGRTDTSRPRGARRRRAATTRARRRIAGRGRPAP